MKATAGETGTIFTVFFFLQLRSLFAKHNNSYSKVSGKCKLFVWTVRSVAIKFQD